MCGSMVDIQSPIAEIKQGKKRKIEITGQKYNGLPYSIGRPQPVGQCVTSFSSITLHIPVIWHDALKAFTGTAHKMCQKLSPDWWLLHKSLPTDLAFKNKIRFDRYTHSTTHR